MDWCHEVVPNYWMDIVLFTLITKVLQYPVGISQKVMTPVPSMGFDPMEASLLTHPLTHSFWYNTQ